MMFAGKVLKGKELLWKKMAIEHDDQQLTFGHATLNTLRTHVHSLYLLNSVNTRLKHISILLFLFVFISFISHSISLFS